MKPLRDTIMKQIERRSGNAAAVAVCVAVTFAWGRGSVSSDDDCLFLLCCLLLYRQAVYLVPGFGVVGALFLRYSLTLDNDRLVGLFCAILYVLVRQYAFSYRQPLLFTILGLTLQ